MIVRDATRDDVAFLHDMVVELAEYQRAAEHIAGTPETLAECLFGPESVAYALVAERDGDLAGMAIWFRTFSTWTSRPGIHLEDLYVREAHRGHQVGLALIRALARIAHERRYPRLSWNVLDWNETAIDFYDRIGAVRVSGTYDYRLTGTALAQLATD